jgi:hypothetical protein
MGAGVFTDYFPGQCAWARLLLDQSSAWRSFREAKRMIISKLLFGCALVAELSVSSAMAASVDAPLVGVWRVTSWQGQEAAGQIMKYYGDHPGGYYVFSKDGHFIFLIVGDNRTAPAGIPPTPEEAAKLYATLAAFDGTYRVTDGNKFVVHVQEAWNQAWAGTDQNREFSINGDVLKVSFTTKSPATGNALTVTTTSQRAE